MITSSGIKEADVPNGTPPQGVLMPFDLDKIMQSKREFRRRLAALPIEEKLAMLDALRERTLIIRSARPVAESGSLRETPPPHQEKEKK